MFALDNTSCFRIKNLTIDLLSSNVSAVIRFKLFEKCFTEVGSVVVGAGIRYIYVPTYLSLIKVDDKFFGFRGRSDNLLHPGDSWVFESKGKLYTIISVVEVIKSAQLVEPCSVVLFTSIPFRFGRGDSLYNGSVGEGDFKKGFVVIPDEGLGNNIKESTISFKTSCSYVVRSGGSDEPACVVILPSTNANPMARSVRFAWPAAGKHKEGIIFAIVWLLLVRKGLYFPFNLPHSGFKLRFRPVFVGLCKFFKS